MTTSAVYRDLGKGSDPTPSRAEGRAYVAAIGIDRYQRWGRLYNAVSDARGALDSFLRLGFTPIGTPLFNELATAEALRRLVTDDLAALAASDSLVLFFAGHGHTVTRTYAGDTTVKDGYLIPYDADLPGGRAGTWLRLESWLADVTRIPAKHILVVLDACHSGLALGPVIKWRTRGGAAPPREALRRLNARRSRRIITSALDDQVAMDNGPVPGHSLFTGCMIEGLRGGLVAASGQTIVTGSQIAQYIQRRVSEYPESTQTPDFGALELDDRGELIVRIAAADELVEARPAPAATAVEVVRAPTRTAASALRRWAAWMAGLVAVGFAFSKVLGPHGALAAPDTPRAEPSLRVPAVQTRVPAVPAPAPANPFVAVAGLRVQAHQVTRREYRAYLDGLRDELRAAAAPLRDGAAGEPDRPVAWTRFEQAAGYCAALAARLPTYPEWERMAAGSWGLDPAGRGRGPLREWTATQQDGWVRVAGATAVMTPRQQQAAGGDPLVFGSVAAFAGRAQPGDEDVSSAEVGFRCVEE